MYYKRNYNSINTPRNRHKKTLKRTIFLIITLLAIGLAAYSAKLYSDDQYKIKLKNEAIAVLAAKEAKKKEPVYINLPGASQIRAIVEDYSLNSSIWKIVNKTNPIPIDYVPASILIPNVNTNTGKSDSEISIRSDIAVPLESMFQAAKSAGYSLMIGSGYRSASLQKTYFDSLAKSVGATQANQSVAYPGQSEHQTGLALDISTVARNCYVADCFADTYDGQWLTKNSYKYGFILRYPKGKEAITEYQYEPWHFRYVGIDLATALHESGLTLDEAWPYLQVADTKLKDNGAI